MGAVDGKIKKILNYMKKDGGELEVIDIAFGLDFEENFVRNTLETLAQQGSVIGRRDESGKNFWKFAGQSAAKEKSAKADDWGDAAVTETIAVNIEEYRNQTQTIPAVSQGQTIPTDTSSFIVTPAAQAMPVTQTIPALPPTQTIRVVPPTRTEKREAPPVVAGEEFAEKPAAGTAGIAALVISITVGCALLITLVLGGGEKKSAAAIESVKTELSAEIESLRAQQKVSDEMIGKLSESEKTLAAKVDSLLGVVTKLSEPPKEEAKKPAQRRKRR